MARYKFRRRSSNYLDNRKQKNRIRKVKTLKDLKLGNAGLVFTSSGLLEFRHILYIKRAVKKIQKKKKKKLTRKLRAKLRRKKKKQSPVSVILFKRKLKKKKQRRFKLKKKKKRCWFFLFPNVVVSRKSTNSRMGKGKGSLRKWMVRAVAKSIFLQFNGYKLRKLAITLSLIKTRLPLGIHIIKKRSNLNKGLLFSHFNKQEWWVRFM